MGQPEQDLALRMAQEERRDIEDESFDCLVRDQMKTIISDVEIAGEAVEEALACGKVTPKQLGCLLLLPSGHLPIEMRDTPIAISEEIIAWYADRMAKAEQEYLAEVERRDLESR